MKKQLREGCRRDNARPKNPDLCIKPGCRKKSTDGSSYCSDLCAEIDNENRCAAMDCRNFLPHDWTDPHCSDGCERSDAA